jgi:hypothetical protein|tara:strand:+ start:10214 stop:11497 length:1284 start_codon:yes stop_codon:yes gene_type:complete
LNRKRKYLNTLFVAFICLLLLPFLQRKFSLWDSKKLYGAFTQKNIEQPEFSDSLWHNGLFQKKYEEYVKESLLDKKDAIRIKSQLEYSFFDKINVYNQVLGKNGWIYSSGFIKKYLGIQKENIKKQAEIKSNLLLIRDYLKKKQVPLIYVIAPAKASLFPNNYPNKYQGIEKKDGDYEFLIETLEELNIDYIDNHKYFNSIKNTAPYLLFARTGIHWSSYGASVFLDTLLPTLQKKIPFDIGKTVIKKYKKTMKYANGEMGTEIAMNLLYKIPKDSTVFPYYKITKSKKKPKVITIGDSFYWSVRGLYVLSKMYSKDSKYFYYMKRSCPNSKEKGISIDKIDVNQEISSSDAVIFITTIGNIYQATYGLEEKIPILSNSKKLKIKAEIIEIKKDKKRMNYFQQKANKKGIPLDSMIYIDLKWLIENR